MKRNMVKNLNGGANDRINYEQNTVNSVNDNDNGNSGTVEFENMGVTYIAKWAIKGNAFHYGDDKGWYGSITLGKKIFGAHTFYMNMIRFSKTVAKSYLNIGRIFTSDGAMQKAAQVFAGKF